jgi:hypothetical protein
VVEEVVFAVVRKLVKLGGQPSAPACIPWNRRWLLLVCPKLSVLALAGSVKQTTNQIWRAEKASHIDGSGN